MNALNLTSRADWLLRLALAAVFFYHSWPKLSRPAPLMGLDSWVVFLVGLAEFGGAAFVLVGGFFKDWLTRLGGLLLLPPMIGAIAMVHWGRWSFTPSESHPLGGMEFQVTLLLIALFFVLYGNGRTASA